MGAGRQRFRIGIRGKLLAFLGIAIIFILAMEIVAQRATYKVAGEYESRLTHYHLVHRMRIALNAFRADGDRYLRDPSSMAIDRLYDATIPWALSRNFRPKQDSRSGLPAMVSMPFFPLPPGPFRCGRQEGAITIPTLQRRTESPDTSTCICRAS